MTLQTHNSSVLKPAETIGSSDSEILKSITLRSSSARGGIPTTLKGRAPNVADSQIAKENDYLSEKYCNLRKKNQQKHSRRIWRLTEESNLREVGKKQEKQQKNEKDSKNKKKNNVYIRTDRIFKIEEVTVEDTNPLGDYVAQMFAWAPTVNHKIDQEQLERLTSSADRLADIGDKIFTSKDGVRIPSEHLKHVAADMVDGAIDGLNDKALQYVVAPLEKLIADYGETILYFFFAVIILYASVRCSSRLQMIGVIGSIIAICAFLKRDQVMAAVSSCCSKLTFFKSEEGEMDTTEPEFLDAQMFDQSSITDVVVGILAFGFFPSSNFSAKKFMSYLSDIGRSYTGIESCVSFVTRIIQRMVDYACHMTGYGSFNLVTTLVPQVDDWIAETRQLLSRMNQSGAKHDVALYEALMRQEDRAYDLVSKYSFDRKNMPINSFMRPLMNEVTRARIFLQQSGVGQHKLRQGPLVLSFAGSSQIGKSKMLRSFVAELLAIVLDGQELREAMNDLDSCVYARQPEHKFWDGYLGQLVCFFDEKDLVAEHLLEPENANTDLIRAGNIFPNVLHMAGIEQKGNTYFRSKVIVCTTNVPTSLEGAMKAVRHPDAVVNRIHFEIATRVRREYAKEEDLIHPQEFWRLDKTKLPLDGSFKPDTHDYILLEKKSNDLQRGSYNLCETEVLTREQLLERCVYKYRALEREAKQAPYDDKEAFQRGLKLREKFRAQGIFDLPHAVLVPEVQYVLPDDFLQSDGSETFYSRFIGLVDTLKRDIGRCVDDMTDTLSHYMGTTSQALKHSLMFLGLIGAGAILLTSVYTMFVDWLFPLNGDSLLKARRAARETSGFVQKRSWLPGSGIRNREGHEYWDYVDSVLKDYTNGTMASQGADPGLEEIASKIWNNNYYSMCFEGDDTRVGWGFFSHSNVFNLCCHYVNVWKNREYGDFNLVCTGNSGYEFTVRVSELFKFKKTGDDWAHGSIASVRLHSDIRPLMCDSSTLLKRPVGNCLMVRGAKGGIERIYSNYTLDCSTRYKDPIGNEYTLPVTLKYSIPTVNGDCGAPIFIVDPTTRCRKFAGFHVAGAKNFGACLLFKADAEEQEQMTTQGAYIPTTMKVIGSVPRPVGNSGVSNIARSPLYGAWGPANKAPAKLRPFVGPDGLKVYPMDKALARYDQPILTYDKGLVSACVRAAVIESTKHEPFQQAPCKISLEEAAVGVEGESFNDGLKRGTSPGYPWNMQPLPGYKGKERFLGRNTQIDLSGPDWDTLVQQVKLAEEELNVGKRPDFYFCDSLKDEILSLQKVEEGNTRMFCPSPIVYQLLFGMYFKEFLVKFMNSRILAEHAVGINVYSQEWDLLKRKLSKFGEERLVAGDFKSFDSLQSAQILREIGEAIIATFGDREYDGIRRLLWCEVWDSKHIVGKDIIQWCQSLPSGHPATTIINCLFVATTVRMCWVRVHEDDISSLRNFTTYVSLITYGDDHALGISEVKGELFNQHTITDTMKTFGLLYTAEDKSSNPPPFRSIWEIEFLKRRFRYEPLVGLVVAPLRLETITEMPYWSKKEGYEAIWREKLETAIRELSLHPPEIFEDWSQTFMNATVKKTGYRPIIIDRQTLIDEVTKKFVLVKEKY